MTKSLHGRDRVAIEDVTPQLDAGRHPVRRILGDRFTVTAAVFADGHDQLAARVLYRTAEENHWQFVSMQALGNDMWSACFPLDRLGEWKFTVLGWIDHFESWAGDMRKRIAAPAEASGDIALALRTGARVL